ncbi:hypothetical protein ACVINW_001311 [Bradyrhizobium sp. USDA 4461]
MKDFFRVWRSLGKTFASLLLILSIIGLDPATHARADAVAFRIQPPPMADRQAAVTALQSSDRAVIDRAIEKTTPVFIFIPGILGSRLSRKAGGVDVPFWGTLTVADLARDNPAFKYNQGESVTVNVLDKFYLPLGLDMDVYGKAYRELAFVMGTRTNVLRFAYDWRQSNVLSARDFSSWLCSAEVQAVAKDRPVVFLAHSMGGLILKYWLEHSYDLEGCSAAGPKFSSYMPIQKIVFAGTPNYGAPKAVLSFSQGQTLYVDPDNDSAIWRALMTVDIKTLSRNLNSYGIRYPSAYQLLPIVNTTSCVREPTWRTDLEFRSENDVLGDIDLFEPKSWELLGWPVQLTGKERESFIANELPSLLSEAKTFLCDVARYDVDKAFEGKVVHFSGFDQKTVCKIVFAAPDYRGDFIPGKCEGDGTVPYWISADIFHLKAGQPYDRQPHAGLMGAKEFSMFLQQLHNEIYAGLALKALEQEGGAAATKKLFKQLRYVPPVNPTMSPEQAASLGKIANEVVAELGVSPKDDIRQFADDKTNQPIDRVNAMLLYSTLSEVTDRQRAWALNNAAHINLTNKGFAQSFELSKRAIGYADTVLTADPRLTIEMKDLKSKAALTGAIASGQLGNQRASYELRKLAIENGSKKALSFTPPSVEMAREPGVSR